MPGMVVPGIPGARLSTGANIVSGAAYRGIDADMVDMETYAVLRACQRFKLPLVALRGISDGAEDLQQIDDWTRYLHIIDERLAAAVAFTLPIHLRKKSASAGERGRMPPTVIKTGLVVA